MKKILIYITLFNFGFLVAQPLPKCVNATKRLFITCKQDTLFYLTDTNILEAVGLKDSCFRVRDIKDSLSTKLFKIEIYKTDTFFHKNSEKKCKYF